jgi:hypothetical protein
VLTEQKKKKAERTREREGRGRERVSPSRYSLPLNAFLPFVLQLTTAVHQFSGVDLVAVLAKLAKRVLHKNDRTTTDCLFFIIQGIFFFF